MQLLVANPRISAGSKGVGRIAGAICGELLYAGSPGLATYLAPSLAQPPATVNSQGPGSGQWGFQ